MAHIKRLREAREKFGEALLLETIKTIRQDRFAPMMTAFKEWVDASLPAVPPQSAMGKALEALEAQLPWSVKSTLRAHPTTGNTKRSCIES